MRKRLTKQTRAKSRPVETAVENIRVYRSGNGRTVDRVPVVCASDLPDCECCGEKWCSTHNEHYADCACVGPHNAEELGYDVIEVKGKLYGVKRI